MRPTHSRIAWYIAIATTSILSGLLLPVVYAGYGDSFLKIQGAGLTRFGRRSIARAKLIRSRL